MPAAKKTETNDTQLQKNVRFYHRFMETPKDAQKSFNNGRFSGTDINPMWRIKILTEVFGPSGFGWWTQNVRYEFVEANVTPPDAKQEQKETSVFCELELIVKDPETGEVSQPIYGVGGNTYIAWSKYGPRASDEAKKMAYTDALSIACKSLGIGHDIWYSNDRTKYTINDTSVPQVEKTAEKTKPVIANTAEQSVEHTVDTATVIDEIAKKLDEIGTKMSTKEEKLAFAKDNILPIIGSMNYKSCTDINKLIALRDKLSA
jgi:hypothetical protein